MNWYALLSALGATLLIPTISAGQAPLDVPADTLLTLGELIEEVSSLNPSLRDSRLENQALLTRHRQVTSWPNPKVMVSFQPIPILTARGFQRSQWRIEQMIPNRGALRLQEKIADHSAEIAGFEAEILEEDLMLQVKEAYYDLYRIQQQEVLIDAFRQRLESFQDIASAQYEVGIGMQQAILKTQLQSNMLTGMKLKLSSERRTAARTLARLQNSYSLDALDSHITVDAPPFPDFQNPEVLVSAYRDSPEVAAFEAASQRADAQVALSQKLFRPDIGFFASYFDISRSSEVPTGTGRDAFSVGFVVSIPIDRDRLRARVEEAEIRKDQVKVRQESLETIFQTRLFDFTHSLDEERQQLDLYKTVLIPQANIALSATLSAYTTGRTDYMDLLDAEQMLFTLEFQYEDLFSQYLKGTAMLENILGVTSLSDLEIPALMD